MRKQTLAKIRWELDSLESLVLKESKADYTTDIKTVGIINNPLDLLKEKKSLQYKLHLRDLLFEKLSEDEKQIICFRFDSKLSVRKICEILFISESTYYRRMKKIYEKLLSFVEQFEGLFYI